MVIVPLVVINASHKDGMEFVVNCTGCDSNLANMIESGQFDIFEYIESINRELFIVFCHELDATDLFASIRAQAHPWWCDDKIKDSINIFMEFMEHVNYQ